MCAIQTKGLFGQNLDVRRGKPDVDVGCETCLPFGTWNMRMLKVSWETQDFLVSRFLFSMFFTLLAQCAIPDVVSAG